MLQGLFLTQGSNPGLLHWQVDSLPLTHLGSPTAFGLKNLNQSIFCLILLKCIQTNQKIKRWNHLLKEKQISIDLGKQCIILMAQQPLPVRRLHLGCVRARSPPVCSFYTRSSCECVHFLAIYFYFLFFLMKNDFKNTFLFGCTGSQLQTLAL